MRYINIYYTFRSDFSIEIVSFQNHVAFIPYGNKIWTIFFFFKVLFNQIEFMLCRRVSYCVKGGIFLLFHLREWNGSFYRVKESRFPVFQKQFISLWNSISFKLLELWIILYHYTSTNWKILNSLRAPREIFSTFSRTLAFKKKQQLQLQSALVTFSFQLNQNPFNRTCGRNTQCTFYRLLNWAKFIYI